MSYNAKNYTEQGGDVTVIGGTLKFTADAKVEGFPTDAITPAVNQADSTAATVSALKEDFNALLAKLKTAGLMASPVVSEIEETTEPEAETPAGSDTPAEGADTSNATQG